MEHSTLTIEQIWQMIVNSNALNFTFFVLILAWVFKKIDVKSLFDGLHQKIIEIIETAKKSREEAHQKLKEVESSVKNLPKELEEIVKDAEKSAETIEQKLIDEAKKQVEQIKSNAQKIIEAEEKMIKSTLTIKASRESIEKARLNVKAALKTNPNLHEKYINESIDEIDRLNF